MRSVIVKLPAISSEDGGQNHKICVLILTKWELLPFLIEPLLKKWAPLPIFWAARDNSARKK